MVIPIINTKLYVPSPPVTLVPRQRLIKQLEAGFGKRLTLISAPAGFGKTTLLSECAATCERPTAWLSLDEGDNDLTRFLTYMIKALQMFSPDFSLGILELLGSQQAPPIDTILTTLVNDISGITEKFILVFDDYHLIESQEVDQAVLFTLNHMPPHMHLVISGRTDPMLPLPRLRARGHLAEIRVNDLRFTPDEAAAFLERGMGLDISAENVAALEARTEGWIAGLQLAPISMQGIKHQDEVTHFVAKFSSSHRYILDYLTDEVLQQRPEGTRDFLLQTSILNRLSASLCKAVTAKEGSQEILETLEGANLFLVPLDEERIWYRYHHLFNDLLYKRLGQIQPDLIPELHLRAAGWYRQNGLIQEALDHYLTSEHYHGAADLVEGNAKALLERSELATLMKWVDALPGEQVRSRPWLCVYHAWALRLSGSRFEAVEERLDDAEMAVEIHREHREHHSNMFPIDKSAALEDEIIDFNGHLSALRAFQHLYKEDIPSVLKLTQRAQAVDLEENFVRASIAFARGWALRFSGNLDAAYQAFDDTKKYALASGNTYMAVAGTCRSAYGRVIEGKLHHANDVLRGAVRIGTQEDGKRYPVAGYAYVYLGGIYYEWNDLITAEMYLLDGIELCGQVGFIMDQVIGLVYLAQVHNAKGDRYAVQETIAQALKLQQKMKTYIYARRWVENCQVRLWHTQGDRDAITLWVEGSGMRIDDDLDYNRDLEHIILARALVYLGSEQPGSPHINDALNLLGRLLEKAESANWMGKGIEILVLQALAHQAQGDHRAALTALDRALTLAEPEGYVRIFIDEGPPMQSLISDYRARVDQGTSTVESGSLPRYADMLLAAFEKGEAGVVGQRKAGEIIAEGLPLVEPLSSRELEVLRLMADGMTNQEIAAVLVIAVTTAKKHVSNIIGKLGVNNRTRAVSRARELELL
jgi:LuxR family maltose regulon positive regulatory protein